MRRRDEEGVKPFDHDAASKALGSSSYRKLGTPDDDRIKIQLRRLARSEYPVEPGLYLWTHMGGIKTIELVEDEFGNIVTFGVGLDDGRDEELDVAELPDGIAWSERLECEVVG